MATYYDWERIIGGHGGKWILFLKNQKTIDEFIRANAIKPVTIGAVSAGETLTAKALVDLKIPGGITAAHLHFEDKIFLLNAEQWAKFSGSIIADAKAKLAQVKEVSFDQAMLLGSMAETLTRG